MSSIKIQIESTARAEKIAGTKVSIDHNLPYVAVDYLGGNEFVVDGHEARAFLEEMVSRADAFNVQLEDMILHVAHAW
ncbi:MAG: hypothetical protein IBX55_22270 [Methyloprofundus sp.]|nr:hypothetical protein [Methyloprofundus sp.]